MTLVTKMITGSGLVLALLVILNAVSYQNTTRLVADAEIERHTQEVLTALTAVFSTLQDLETGQRGFVLTDETRYLEPYDTALLVVQDRQDTLRHLTSDNPAQQQRLDRLAPLIEEKLDELEQTITLRREVGLEAALDVIVLDTGQVVMDNIRALIGEMEAEEFRLLTIRQQQSEASVTRTLNILLYGSLLCVMLIGGTTILVGRSITRSIGALMDGIDTIARGDLTARIHVTSRDETATIASAISSMAQGLEQSQAALQAEITDRAVAEDAFRTSEARFRELAESIRDVFWVFDIEQQAFTYVSPAYEEIWGRPGEEVCGHGFDSPHAIHPDDRDAVTKAFVSNGPRGTFNEQYRVVRPDGSLRWVHNRGFKVTDADGVTRRVVGVAKDVSDQKQLEQQLVQSQKMEGIGRLAGGIAHDFNNILTAVLGYSQMLLEQIDEDKPMYVDLKEIEVAANRAAALTRQLLAFSRQQVVNLVVLDVNGVVSEIEQMLRPLIGADVIMTTKLTPEHCPIKADSTQIEQILVNLAVNARDAMPSGGTLTIETATVTLATARAEDGATVPPGRYARISVSDTGCGMTADTKTHLFEPFFTTKEKGKGTGLGLATVYGTVKQLGGFVFAHSRLPQGTTFEILLPHCDELVPRPAPEFPTRTEIGAGEVVLLVEDDPMVRKFSAAVLTRHGYRVLEADAADRALTFLEEFEDPIHLLLTDVVMPGMSGLELTEIVETRRPETKILLMSGYTDRALAKDVMGRGGGLLQKPFSAETLLRRIRRVLDSGPARDADATA